MTHSFPIQQWINTSNGLTAVTAEYARFPMPIGPFSKEVQLYYGPYLDAISSLLLQNHCRALQLVLTQHLHRPVSLSEVFKVDIISEKHGALYHVACLRVQLFEENCSMAINVAVTLEQQAFLENEYDLLKRLSASGSDRFLPTPYFKGETAYRTVDNVTLKLKLFIAEWFDDFYEFHLSTNPKELFPVIKVWDRGVPGPELNKQQTYSLYRLASTILTTCLDGRSFRQIHPWHHAAGDFIVKRRRDKVDLRLITVRDYRCLLPPGHDCQGVSNPLVLGRPKTWFF